VCDWDNTIEISITRKVQVDKCIAPVVSRLNQLGVYTTGSCCGHGKGIASVTILPSSAHRAKSLGLSLEFSNPGMCPVLELAGLNLALINAAELPPAPAARAGATS
jgi:hypothetical protein